MNSAKRLYGKKVNTLNQQRNTPVSSFFLSKVQRKVNYSPNNNLGPGQYNISLPLVKPTFQTILKNDNTVIVKFNNHFSSVFHSKSPRFKNHNEKDDRINQKTKFMQYKKELNNFQNQQIYNNDYANELSNSLLICQMQQNNKNSHNQQNKHRKRISDITKKKLTKSIITNLGSSKQENLQYQNQIKSIQHQTLPVASRLHNQQPLMIQTQKFQSNRYNSSVKSTQWSKYKLKRNSFVEKLDNYQLPGPGSYAVKQPKYKNYNQLAQITSWQFNSRTSRSPFDQLTLKQQILRHKILNKSLKYDFSPENLGQDPEQNQMKKKILSKKLSKGRMSSFRNPKTDELKKSFLEPDFNFQFTAIHSRQNLFIDEKGNVEQQ